MHKCGSYGLGHAASCRLRPVKQASLASRCDLTEIVFQAVLCTCLSAGGCFVVMLRVCLVSMVMP